MLSLVDMLMKEAKLNDTTAKLLVGRKVRIKGFVESGDFDIMETIKSIEFVKKITGTGDCLFSSIYDVKLELPSEDYMVDFSCISEMEVARCSNLDCGSEINIEDRGDEGLWCSRCGNVISQSLGDWVVYKVEASSEKVKLLRV